MARAQILIVEDENIVALDIKHRLISLGYEVLGIASSGEQAIRAVENRLPDLVLMDIKLRGEMDGIQATEGIRSRFDIPVIYLTAFVDGITLQRAKLTGPFGYLLKPFEERELYTAIEMALYKHQIEKRLKESERWLSTTLKSIGDAVIATDDQSRVQFMNPVAEALTGWLQEEALGKKLGLVFHIIDQETEATRACPVTKVLQEGRTIELEAGTLLVARDGKRVPIDDSAAPIRDEKGQVIGVVLVFRDVSERVQAEQALRQYTTELETQNQDLEAYAYTVAHDLKNPLNLVIGYAEILRSDCASMSERELQQCLKTVAQNSLKMNSIVEELLLLASARQMEIETTPLDMASIVIEAHKRLSPMIEEHQAEIIMPSEWPVAQGYGPWIEEIWVNYLSNGIKYGGRPPRLVLGATAQPDGMVKFWIQDNGPGLTLEDQAHLFTPFTRVGQTRADGRGLGLFIVRRIAERLDGQIGVESQIGGGSVFSFTLPSNGRHSSERVTSER